MKFSNCFSFFLVILISAVSSLLLAATPPEFQVSESLKSVQTLNEYIFKQAPFASCHASTIAEATDGTLVAAWFGGTQEGAGDVAIWSSCRRNGKWSAPKLVGDADKENVPCWNPVLFQPSKGPMYLFYKVDVKIANWHGELLRSDDCGQTWTQKRILPEFFIGPVKNKPVELADGTVLCPSSTEHDGWRIHIERIPGFAQTWSRTEALNTKDEGEAIQPSILFHSDGKLQMICRNKNGNGRLWQLWSNDNGQTWSRLQPLDLPNPCSGTDAVTLKDGRHILVYNHSTVKTAGRNFLNVAVSDDGVHWKAVCVLENRRGEYSYPAVIQTKDGKIHITYTWQRLRIKHVVLDPAKIVGVPIVKGVWPESVK